MRLSILSLILVAVLLLGSVSAYAGPIVVGGPVLNSTNGHTYYLLSSGSWSDSEAAAVSLGGHLATINDATENDWVLQTFAVDQNLWIGFYQPPGSSEPDGGWTWISGVPVSYVNFRFPEPNNTFGAENFAFIWGCLEDMNNDPRYRQAGWWNDFPDTGIPGYITLPYGVVEAVPVPEPGSTLLFLGIGLVPIAFSCRWWKK
jgi:hypothetical protein